MTLRGVHRGERRLVVRMPRQPTMLLHTRLVRRRLS